MSSSKSSSACCSAAANHYCCGCKEEEAQVAELLTQVNHTALCQLASSLRLGQSCTPGDHGTGGFNVVIDLNFADGVTWLARIPLPWNNSQPDKTTLSNAAMLRYLKKNTKIPVPEVFAYALGSDPNNAVGMSYILMEKLPGKACPEMGDELDNPTPTDLDHARKIHEQLTDIILELASCKFDQIGSLREREDGTFYITEYTSVIGTGQCESRAAAYRKLDPKFRGPFHSTSELYSALALLARNCAIDDPDDYDKGAAVAEYELLAEMIPHFVHRHLNKGPFVPHHDDLSLNNILVDEHFNITGIIDWPGTVMPLPSLCVFPWFFRDNSWGLVTREAEFAGIFINRDCAKYLTSLLASKDLRRELMDWKKATKRQDFEKMFAGVIPGLPHIFEDVYGREFNWREECKRIAEEREWFKELVPKGADGLYAWERKGEKNPYACEWVPPSVDDDVQTEEPRSDEKDKQALLNDNAQPKAPQSDEPEERVSRYDSVQPEAPKSKSGKAEADRHTDQAQR